jgi:hypothetical protein
MTLLSAAIISASDAKFSIQVPTGNAAAARNITTRRHQYACHEHWQSVERSHNKQPWIAHHTHFLFHDNFIRFANCVQ